MAGIIVTWSNHFNNGFHFDDSHTINNNIYIRDIGNMPMIFTQAKAFGSMPNNLGFEPVTTGSTAIDYYVSKKDPFGINKDKKYEEGLIPFYYHLPMFIFFLLQGVLMFFLLLAIFNISYKSEMNVYLALFAIAWYLLHPGNAETVNYICQRAEIFSTFFVVLGVLLYARSPFCRKYFIYLIPPVIGVFSKETATMFPALLFLYIFFFEKKLSVMDFFRRKKIRETWSAIKKSLPAFIVLFAAIMSIQILLYVQTASSGSLHSGNTAEHYFSNYLKTQPYVLLTYFLQFFVPMGLSSDPDLEVFTTYSDPRMWAGFLFIIALVAVSVLASRSEKGRPIAFGFFWFLVASIPTSVLAALSQVSNSHRLYFPYVGLVIAVVWALYLFIDKIKVVFSGKSFAVTVISLAALLLVANAYGTSERNKVWKTDASLWADIVQKSPGNARALMNYGLSKMESGDFWEAEYYYRKALALWPNWCYIRINLGILKNAQGLEDEAEQWFLSAIRVAGNSQEPFYYYGRFCYEHKMPEKAILYLNQAIAISQGDLKSRYLIMSIYADLGQWENLKSTALSTLQLIPGDATSSRYLEMANTKNTNSALTAEEVSKNPSAEGYLSLSVTYYNQKEFQKCIEACQEALKFKPDYAEAYNNICSAYNELGKWDLAIEACEKALKINPQFERASNNLKWAQSQKVAGK
jgi:tetratricopeptide (TPR) repeat protein